MTKNESNDGVFAELEEQIGQCSCMGDDLSSVLVLELQIFAQIREAGRVRRRTGARRYVLSSGESVAYLGPEHFIIVDTGEILTKAGPPPADSFRHACDRRNGGGVVPQIP